ncbi:hypothetical protein GOODEAATRI_011562, partial [Goodea atripinnis]
VFRKQVNNNNSSSSHESLVFQVPHGHKPGTFPTSLAHKHLLSPIIDNTSVNWRTGSFHGYRGRHRNRRGASSLVGGDQSPVSSSARIDALDHRLSVYDNVPDDVQLSEGEDGGSGSDAERISEESEGQPAALLVQQAEPNLFDLQSGSGEPVGFPDPPAAETVSPQTHSTDGQILPVQQAGLELPLLDIVENLEGFEESRCGSNGASGFCRTVPKTLNKTKTTAEVKGRQVFGVPLLVSVQQTGEPLPPCILRALVYLRTECLDQHLREMVESDPDGFTYEGQSAFDVADMVKQYFRDLPEPLFTSKLCETFLHIYQYFPKDQQLLAAQAAILLLPDENREALRTLLFFLRDVVSCVDQNQMTPTNVAVCLAPSLFHLNTIKRESNAARKYSLGRPDQRDLSENLAATQGLAVMITEAQRLFQLPEFWPGQSFIEDSSEGGDEELEERRNGLQLRTQKLLSDARDRSGCWENHWAPENVELAFKKVSRWKEMSDGCPLWMWRGSVEVDAPQQDLLHRLLRDQQLWEANLRRADVIQTLSKDTEVYRYTLQCQAHDLGSQPPQENLLLRTWQADPSCGPLYLSSTSTEMPEVQVEGVRPQVHCCLYLLEPTGAIKTRLTHLCRTDPRYQQTTTSRLGGN